MSDEERYKILAELAKYTGKIVPAAFIKRTKLYIPWIERFHNLITGIFKPAGSEFAMCISVKAASPYSHKDDVVYLDDGRWLMEYSPRKGGTENKDNIALMKCLTNSLPIGVLQQITNKNSRDGSTYKVLGLGMVTEYYPDRDVFVVESVDIAHLIQITNFIQDESTRYETQIYAQMMNKFQPFIKEENITYTVNAPKREQSFRRIILREYEYTCAICQMSFVLENLIETTAAHIVPKRRNGTDDPRNGLSLCRTHHWAFDEGLFTVSDEYRIIVSPALDRAKHNRFHLLEFDRQNILTPKDQRIAPSSIALQWHRENIWRTG